ncbi:MAG: hypothetical protein ACRDI3_06720 [Actinomycetota bacterium]
MEADIAGHQRKVVRSLVRPLRAAVGVQGIPVRAGSTLPFSVARGWNAPAGYYPEGWYLVIPDTGEVLHEAYGEVTLIWGLQSVTDLTTAMSEPIELAPGRYQIVFVLGGIRGGTIDVEAFEASSEAA